VQTLAMRQKEKLVKWAACALVVGLVTGCFPYPHTTRRSSEVSGTVLDARTRAPIKGAKVVQSEGGTVDSPETRTRTTDAAGHFRLKVSHNFHLAIIGAGEGQDWPPPRHYEAVTISYPNYLSYEIQGWGEVNVLLEPVKDLELRGRVLDARTNVPIQGARVSLSDCMSLSCTTDAAGHFRLKAGPEFYQEYSTSQAAGHPFRDWVVVSRGDYGVRSFHWAEPEDTHAGLRAQNILVQAEQ
jgi:hypothetical protein